MIPTLKMINESAASTNATGNETDSDDYEYDWEESSNIFFWDELVPTLVVYGLTLVLGVVGNSLIVFTILRYKRMKSATNVFLASLASADLLLIIVCIPVKVAKLFSYTWTMGEFLCKSVHYIQNVSAISSVLTLTAMSTERYYAIVHPMRAKYTCTIRQATKIILGTWVASFLLSIPILFVQVLLPVGGRVKAYWCVRNWDDVTLWQAYEVYMLLLLLVVPTIIMGATYSSISCEVWRVMKRRQTMTTGQGLQSMEQLRRAPRTMAMRHSSRCSTTSTVRNRLAEDDNRTVKQVVKMLIAVVALFVVCWAPVLIDNVLTAYGVLPFIRTANLKHMATAFHLMAYFNSCINPIVYGFMSRNFRESFHKALARCCLRRKVRLPPREAPR
ncbi:gastrin/cholecystokinin type B receptor-like isoform X3 [Cloeon dipterum]|uniref:gastrin/cholecystokinin type B receptor-like isoform X3 n=1 Tax=Cloeon dipterum TaxID=197152 RepID=UPI00321F7678